MRQLGSKPIGLEGSCAQQEPVKESPNQANAAQAKTGCFMMPLERECAESLPDDSAPTAVRIMESWPAWLVSALFQSYPSHPDALPRWRRTAEDSGGSLHTWAGWSYSGSWPGGDLQGRAIVGATTDHTSC